MTGPHGSAPGRRPNIVVVLLDCVRAKSVRTGGASAGAVTPVLDRLARPGTYFPRAVAPANWTIPSHMSFFTGEYPSAHGLRTFRPGAAPRETIAGWLKRRGYATALLSEMVHLVAGYGLEDGFDYRFARRLGLSDADRTTTNRLVPYAGFLYSEPVRRLLARLPPLVIPMNAFNHPQEVAFKQQFCGEYMVEAFSAYLAARDRRRPFFAFVNLVNAHEPYVAEGLGPLARWFARTPRYYLLAVEGLQREVPWSGLLGGYHRSIEEADAKVGRLLAALDREGLSDETLVIVTSDHGQSFGEGGNVYHGCGATDSITRVPLWVRPPAGFSVPGRVERWTSLCDLPSWIRAAASGLAPYDDEGRAPFPHSAAAPDDGIVYCEGAPASDPNRSLRGIRTDQLWNHRLLAAYREEEKYILDLETGRVYGGPIRPEDEEQPAPAPVDPARADRVRSEWFGAYEGDEARRRRVERPGTPGALPEDLAHRLRSWGYG